MQPNPPPKKKFFSRKTIIGLTAVVILVYVAGDLFLPTNRDLRSFDPAEVARLETAMWKSYYDRHPVKIYFELAEMLRTQFHFSFLRSYVGAYYAARAAFVFKDHKNDSDLERAEGLLVSYFSLIRKTGNIDFDMYHATALELRWWVVHRQRDTYSEVELGKACAEAAAAVYQIPPASATEHGMARAQAMTIRDAKSKEGGVREEDWKRIEELLLKCYGSLREAVDLRMQPGQRNIAPARYPALFISFYVL